MRVIVTGGAGYIGCHAVVELLNSDHEVCVIDNLSNGNIESIHRVNKLCNSQCLFVKGDIRNSEDLNIAFSKFKPEAIIHFAGLKSVQESCINPIKYYENNVIGSIKLLQAMDAHNCKLIVFSSSATVYGDPQYLPLDEDHPLNPANPYGHSKLNVENILKDWSINGRKAISLRYFNPVGAHESGQLGEDSIDAPNNLMPYIDQVAVGKKEKLKIFGNNYNTRDGTGERDYIHVTDLVLAHLKALNLLETINSYEVINIGTGVGVTVKELVEIYQSLINIDIPYEIVNRREGDIACSIADPSKAHKVLNWKANLSINEAISSSFNWQTQNPEGYKN